MLGRRTRQEGGMLCEWRRRPRSRRAWVEDTPRPPNSHKLANEHRGNDNQEAGPHMCEVVEWDGRRPADPEKGPREKESSEATG